MTRVKESSTEFENKNILAEKCPEVYAAAIIGGQWTLAICCYLIGDGRLRFNELKRRLPNITDRMLTLQLRKLEKNGIITRTVFPEVPPRVEYELTAIGYQLNLLIKELESWGNKHREVRSSLL